MGMAELVKHKVVLLGDGAVGKTSLVRRYVEDFYSDDYRATIGAKVSQKNVLIATEDGDYDVQLMIWDIMGQAQFEAVTNTGMDGASGALIVFDITRIDTLDSVIDWVRDLYRVTGPVPVIILANKSDLTPRSIDYAIRLQELSEAIGCAHLFTSAKTGGGVEDAFATLAAYVAPLPIPPPPPQRALVRHYPTDPLVIALDLIIQRYATKHDFQTAMETIQDATEVIGLRLGNLTVENLRELVDSLAPPVDDEPPAAERVALLGILDSISPPGPGRRTREVRPRPPSEHGPGPTPRQITKDQVSHMRLAELIVELQRRNLPVSGKLRVLRDRLKEHLGAG